MVIASAVVDASGTWTVAIASASMVGGSFVDASMAALLVPILEEVLGFFNDKTIGGGGLPQTLEWSHCYWFCGECDQRWRRG